MLRTLVLLLVIVNAAFFAWTQGWLKDLVDFQPDSQHEPQRMARQVNADQIVVVSAGTSAPAGDQLPATSPFADASASDAASEPVDLPEDAPDAGDAASDPFGRDARMSDTLSSPPGTARPAVADAMQCLEAGPFTQAELGPVEASLKPVVPAGSWSTKAVSIQGLWLVYMGPYADAGMLQRKQAELRHIKGLDFEEVRTPANLALGISLGRFNRLADADAGLAKMRNRGIRTARIVNVRPPMELKLVRIEQASASTRNTLESIKLPEGKNFVACRP